MTKLISHLTFLLIGYTSFFSAQVFTPNGNTQNTSNPQTNNLGINESTPKANIEILQKMQPSIALSGSTDNSNPAIKIRSSRYYQPQGTGLQNQSIKLKQSNIIEIFSEYNQLTSGTTLPNPIPLKERFIMNQNGKIGLGTSPNHSILNIEYGKYGDNQTDQNDLVSFSYNGDNDYPWEYSHMGYDKSTFYLTRNAKFQNSRWFVDEGSDLGESNGLFMGYRGISFKVYRHPDNQQGATTHKWNLFKSDWINTMTIRNGGQVIIGDSTIVKGKHTDFLLSVDGKFIAKEAVITLDGWADYVFDDGYKLKPLNEIEEYIQKEKKLPGFKNEKEMISEGLNIEYITVKQQEKIEELFLYIIELEKRISQLETENLKFKND